MLMHCSCFTRAWKLNELNQSGHYSFTASFANELTGESLITSYWSDEVGLLSAKLLYRSCSDLKLERREVEYPSLFISLVHRYIYS